MDSRELFRKADVAISDLTGGGGYLADEQADRFIRKLLAQPTLMSRIRSITMNAPRREISKVGIGSQILHPGVITGERTLDSGDRVDPTFSKVILQTEEVMAEIRIPYEVLEDNIERGNLQDTLVDLIVQRAAVDLENLLLNGDTASANTFLALFDGVIKLATSNVYDAADAALSPAVLGNTIITMPDQYRTPVGSVEFWVPAEAEIKYRIKISERQTGLGDATLQGINQMQVLGSRLVGASYMPSTNIIYTDPQNIILGIQRQMQMEAERFIRGRYFTVVLTMRLAINIEEEEAVTKVTNLGTSLLPV